MRPTVTGVGPAIAKTVEETVRLSDIVKASDEDLEALYPGRVRGRGRRATARARSGGRGGDPGR